MFERLVSLLFGSKDVRLAKAARRGSVKRVRSLLGAGANPNAVVEAWDKGPKWPILFSAVLGDNLAVVDLLLVSGGDPNAPTSDGRTCLIEASGERSPEVIARLLAAGADPERTDDEGYTALRHAIMSCRWGGAVGGASCAKNRAVRALLEGGADPNRCEKDGTSPLQLVLSNGGGDKCQYVHDLVEAHANPNVRDKDGVTPLMLASFQGLAPAVGDLLRAGATTEDTAKRDAGAFKGVLFNQGIEAAVRADAQQKPGFGVLMGALAAVMLQKDKDDGRETNALALAVQAGHFDCVRELLGAGANPNPRLSGCDEPLTIAIRNGHPKIAELLRANGASDPTQPN